MTIAQAFNEIAVAQGGTASTSGTIAGAIDALNDALAGSDQVSAQTIEDAVRLLGQNIGGGGGGGGDFTTATVKLQNAEGSAIALGLNCACVAPEGLPDASFVNQYSENASLEFTAVLYKGKCLAYPTDNGAIITTEGNVTYDSDLDMYIITGDCTFTFSNENTI